MTRAGADSPISPRSPLGLWVAWSAALALLVAAASSVGGPQGPVVGLLVVAETALRTGWPAAAIVFASLGLGRLIAPAFALRGRWAELAIGLAVMLLAMHVLGSAGLLGVGTHVLVWGGVAAAVLTQRRRGVRLRPPSGWAWLGLPGVALLLTAAASPPGTLWASEYGGYDALSYHLQLPREWLAAGSTLPVDHNAYSFLPGGLEVLFTAVGHLTLAVGGGDSPAGLLAGGGWRLLSMQYVHAALAIAAAGAVASVARRLAVGADVGAGVGRPALAAMTAGGLVLCTPWTIVVGSLAYNEMGVLLLGAGSMLAAARARHAAARRSIAAALLVGVACLIKPTALVFVAPVVGVLLLARVPRRRLAPALAAGAVAGMLALSPWLVRNAVLTGNPVFPLAASTLGTGHWSDAQAERFAAAHAPEGSADDRLRLLAWTDPDAAGSAPAVARWRGAANPQWGAAFAVGLGGLGLLLGVRRTHTTGAVLAAGLSLQLLAWLGLTHLQSRFLLPCLLTLAPATGLAVAALPHLAERTRLGLAAAATLTQAGFAWWIYAGQLGGTPAAVLLPGPAAMMGEPYDPASASPTGFINHQTPADARVFLVGGATPLYLDRPVHYATVWDRPVAMSLLDTDADNDDGMLRPGDYVLIDAAELARQRSSGYLDPAVTPELIARLTRDLRPVRAWPELGVSLFRAPTAEGGDRP